MPSLDGEEDTSYFDSKLQCWASIRLLIIWGSGGGGVVSTVGMGIENQTETPVPVVEAIKSSQNGN